MSFIALHNSTVIKISKLMLLRGCYLIHSSYSDFVSCPSSTFLEKRKSRRMCCNQLPGLFRFVCLFVLIWKSSWAFVLNAGSVYCYWCMVSTRLSSGIEPGNRCVYAPINIYIPTHLFPPLSPSIFVENHFTLIPPIPI